METFPCYSGWPFVWGIHLSPVNSPHNGQQRGALMFSLICVWIHGWVNNRVAGDLRRYRAHYDVIVLLLVRLSCPWSLAQWRFCDVIVRIYPNYLSHLLYQSCRWRYFVVSSKLIPIQTSLISPLITRINSDNNWYLDDHVSIRSVFVPATFAEDYQCVWYFLKTKIRGRN